MLDIDAPGGVIVSTVAPEGPADEAGMEPGGVIVTYAGEAVENSLDLQRRVVGTRPGCTGIGQRQRCPISALPLTFGPLAGVFLPP